MAKGSAEITAHGTANWFAGTCNNSLVCWYIHLSSSDIRTSFPHFQVPCHLRQIPYVTPPHRPWGFLTSLNCRTDSRSAFSLQPSSVSIDEVCAVSSKVAYCCWCWLKHHQSLSRWLWMLHKSAYIRAVSNNNRSLMHPPLNLRWKMQHCQQDPLLVLQTSTSIKVSFQTLQKVLS